MSDGSVSDTSDRDSCDGQWSWPARGAAMASGADPPVVLVEGG